MITKILRQEGQNQGRTKIMLYQLQKFLENRDDDRQRL